MERGAMGQPARGTDEGMNVGNLRLHFQGAACRLEKWLPVRLLNLKLL